jgi:hypothetical protein
VSHPLGQRVQAEEQKTKSQDGKNQNDGHDDHKDIGLTRRGDERRQMMRRGRMKWFSQTALLSRTHGRRVVADRIDRPAEGR